MNVNLGSVGYSTINNVKKQKMAFGDGDKLQGHSNTLDQAKDIIDGLKTKNGHNPGQKGLIGLGRRVLLRATHNPVEVGRRLDRLEEKLVEVGKAHDQEIKQVRETEGQKAKQMVTEAVAAVKQKGRKLIGIFTLGGLLTGGSLGVGGAYVSTHNKAGQNSAPIVESVPAPVKRTAVLDGFVLTQAPKVISDVQLEEKTEAPKEKPSIVTVGPSKPQRPAKKRIVVPSIELTASVAHNPEVNPKNLAKAGKAALEALGIRNIFKK